MLSAGSYLRSPVRGITRVFQGSILLRSAARHYREDGQPHLMPCAVFVPCCNPSRVFLQPASQIAEGSSPVWFCKVLSLLWVSLSALQPPVKRLEASPSLLASFWYSNLHLPLFPSCAECSCLLNSLGTAPPKSKPPVSHLVRMETCWFWLEWSCRGSNCFFCRVPTNPALLSFNYIPFGRPFMASSSSVFTEFQDGN